MNYTKFLSLFGMTLIVAACTRHNPGFHVSTDTTGDGGAALGDAAMSDAASLPNMDAAHHEDMPVGCTPITCAQVGRNCGDLDDGCGHALHCGDCHGTDTCGGDGRAGICGCTPTTCSALGKNCSSVSDGCGHSLFCGSCSGYDTCGGGGAIGVCGCTPKSCVAQRKNCGNVSDGCGRTMNCGSCNNGEVCGGAGESNVCGRMPCVPRSCVSQGKNCDSIDDGCGMTLACGSCTAPQTCGGGGQDNVCGCPAESDAVFCARLGAACGFLSGRDNCGNARSASCGGCSFPNICGGGGVTNQCGCTPNCSGRVCGDDGCGGTCSPGCPMTRTCFAGTRCVCLLTDMETYKVDGTMVDWNKFKRVRITLTPAGDNLLGAGHSQMVLLTKTNQTQTLTLIGCVLDVQYKADYYTGDFGSSLCSDGPREIVGQMSIVVDSPNVNMGRCDFSMM